MSKEPKLAPSRVEKKFVAATNLVFGLLHLLGLVITLKLGHHIVELWQAALVFLAVTITILGAWTSIRRAWWAWTCDVLEYEYETGYNRRQENLSFDYHLNRMTNGKR